MSKTKVVQGGDMFFKDDIRIDDTNITSTLSLPDTPIFSRDELRIMYNGHIFVATKTSTPNAQIKVYTLEFGLKEAKSPKEKEDKYFSDNSNLIDKIKSDFIKKCVRGISILDDDKHPLKGALGTQIGSELVERVVKEYDSKISPRAYTPPPGKGLITKLSDGSILNSYMNDCERVLLLDGKAYDLETIPEYISIFKNSFKPSFYKEVKKKCASASPEEIYQFLTDNSDKIHRKALPYVRNKIWYSNRSFKLLLDETYWIPQFRGKVDDLVSKYQKLIERKIKIDAIKESLGCKE